MRTCPQNVYALRRAAKHAKEEQRRQEMAKPPARMNLDDMFEKEKEECTFLVSAAAMIMCVVAAFLCFACYNQKNVKNTYEIMSV